MTKSKTPAKAEPKAMSKAITALRIKPAKIGDLTTPCAFIKGDAPRVGAKLQFTFKGVEYSGIVATANQIGGEMRVSFKDGIAATK